MPRTPHHERARHRAAAGHARLALPGPVGEPIHRELTACAEFGHRVGDGLIPRLTAAVLAIPAAGPHQAAPGGRGTRGLSRRGGGGG